MEGAGLSTLSHLQSIRDQSNSVWIIRLIDLIFQIGYRFGGSTLFSGLHQSYGNICGQGGFSLNSSQHLLMMDKTDGVKGTIGILMFDNPGFGSIQNAVVNVDQSLRFRKAFQD